MKSLAVTELKAQCADIIEQVRSGEEIIITYGKHKENVAVIIPYHVYQSKSNAITLGLLSDKNIVIHDGFKMSEEELLGL